MSRLRALCVIAALLVAGCGGGGGGGASTPTTPTPAPTPPATENFSGTVAAYAYAFHTFTPARAGAATITLTWSAGVDLDLYVTGSACTGYPPDQCIVVARSVASTGTEEKVSITVQAGVALRLWVDNFSPTTAAAYTITTAIS